MSDALKLNTTLTVLDLYSEFTKKQHKRHPFAIHSFPFSPKTGNKIGERGATSLSDALKSNTTLIRFSLGSEHNRDNAQIVSIN